MDEGKIHDVGEQVLAAIRDAENPAEPQAPEPDVASTEEQPDLLATATAPDAPVEEEDRTGWITVNGHQYRDQDAVFKALEEAQKYISSGAHKQQGDDEEPDDEEDQAAYYPPQPLLGKGVPLGGEPATQQDLIDWAMEDVSSATQWALANQDRVPTDLVQQLWTAWTQVDPAGTTAFSQRWTLTQQETLQQQLYDNLAQMLRPVIERDREHIAEKALTIARATPGFDQFEQQVWDQLQQADPEYHAWFESLSEKEMADELVGIYAAQLGRQYLARVQNGGGGGVPAATGQPTPMQTPLPSKAGVVTTTTSTAEPRNQPGSNTNDQADRELQLWVLNQTRGVQGQPQLTEMPE